MNMLLVLNRKTLSIAYALQCDIGLVCFERDAGGIPVPGCSGSDSARNDYCINDPNRIVATTPKPPPPPVAQPVYIPVTQPVAIPATGFVPATPRPTNRPTPQPTPAPATTTNTKAFVATEQLAIVGNNGSPVSRFPLKMCQGKFCCSWGPSRMETCIKTSHLTILLYASIF